MARRALNAGLHVPGVRAALADHYRRRAEWWDAPRSALIADVLDQGDPVTVTGDTLSAALHRADHPDAPVFLHDDETVYRLDAEDLLIPQRER